MRYHHTQIGWTSIIGIAFGMLLIMGLLWNAERIVVGPMVIASLALIFVLGIAIFGKLTTTIDQSEFRIRFGWLGWPGKTVPLSEIIGAIPTKTAPISGWGIRITTRGWLYNVSGRNAVIVATCDDKQFWLAATNRSGWPTRSMARWGGHRCFRQFAVPEFRRRPNDCSTQNLAVE